jgi:hypothetical protein
MYFTEIKRNLARHPTYFLMMLMVFVLVQSMLVLMWLDARYAYVEYRQMKSSAHANSIYQTQIDMNNSDEQYYLTSDEALRAAVVYRESLESLPGMIPFEAQLTPLCTTEDTVSMPSLSFSDMKWSTLANRSRPVPSRIEWYEGHRQHA